jgi:voltage-gated potassium channel Kch
VLEAAGIAEARAVIVTIPDDDAALRAVQAVRQASAHVFIGVRTQFLSGKIKALALGASEVVVAEVAVASAMDREMVNAMQKAESQTQQ